MRVNIPVDVEEQDHERWIHVFAAGYRNAKKGPLLFPFYERKEWPEAYDAGTQAAWNEARRLALPARRRASSA